MIYIHHNEWLTYILHYFCHVTGTVGIGSAGVTWLHLSEWHAQQTVCCHPASYKSTILYCFHLRWQLHGSSRINTIYGQWFVVKTKRLLCLFITNCKAWSAYNSFNNDLLKHIWTWYWEICVFCWCLAGAFLKDGPYRA